MIPGPRFSDHPSANLSAGESYVASVVDAVARSPEWYSTAIFVSWDDYGGFYDHVAPPSVDALGLSFRVPLLVISPYTPAGLIVHSLGYFESLLHFVEWRFGLGCLTARDCQAPLPLDYFNFQSPPRAPYLFPTDPGLASYPIVDPGATTLTNASYATAGPGCSPYCIEPQRWDTGPPPPTLAADQLD